MDQSKVQVNVFVGAISNATHGGWLTLPMSKDELEEKIAAFGYGDREYSIMDLETDLQADFGQYLNVSMLNQDLLLIRVFEERGQLDMLLTAYSYRNEDLEEAIDFLEGGNYEFYEDVTDEKTLGQAVIASGKFGWFLAMPDAIEALPEVKRMKKYNSLQVNLIAQYLDHESIGQDLVCNGCIIYPKLKTAIVETAH
jgi:hypothetical protein